MPWFWPIGRPNTTRSFAYCAARFSAARPRPIASTANSTRSGLRPLSKILKPCALFADQLGVGDFEVFDEERVALHRLAAHFRDRLRFDVLAIEVGVEERQAFRRPLRLILRRRARDEQNLVRALRVGRPNLAAV